MLKIQASVPAALLITAARPHGLFLHYRHIRFAAGSYTSVHFPTVIRAVHQCVYYFYLTYSIAARDWHSATQLAFFFISTLTPCRISLHFTSGLLLTTDHQCCMLIECYYMGMCLGLRNGKQWHYQVRQLKASNLRTT